MRADGRKADQLRAVAFERGYTRHAPGSVLVSFGDTRVLCTATIEEVVPRHRVGKGGWLTAEYDMLPGSTSTRKARSARRGQLDGRSVEIQRLIGRSLRSVIDLDQLGEVTVQLDCDVLQADGGTRTAAITGAYVALHDACLRLKEVRKLKYWPLIDSLCAISVGVVKGEVLLDLDYSEDLVADLDMNVVMRGNGHYVELQGTAEGEAVPRERLLGLLDLAEQGCATLHAMIRKTLA